MKEEEKKAVRRRRRRRRRRRSETEQGVLSSENKKKLKKKTLLTVAAGTASNPRICRYRVRNDSAVHGIDPTIPCTTMMMNVGTRSTLPTSEAMSFPRAPKARAMATTPLPSSLVPSLSGRPAATLRSLRAATASLRALVRSSRAMHPHSAAAPREMAPTIRKANLHPASAPTLVPPIDVAKKPNIIEPRLEIM